MSRWEADPEQGLRTKFVRLEGRRAPGPCLLVEGAASHALGPQGHTRNPQKVGF